MNDIEKLDELIERIIFSGHDARDAYLMVQKLKSIKQTLQDLQIENSGLKEVLRMIATPKRSDGTYNRSREECERLARSALEKK